MVHMHEKRTCMRKRKGIEGGGREGGPPSFHTQASRAGATLHTYLGRGGRGAGFLAFAAEARGDAVEDVHFCMSRWSVGCGREREESHFEQIEGRGRERRKYDTETAHWKRAPPPRP